MRAKEAPTGIEAEDKRTTRTFEAFQEIRRKIIRLELPPGSGFTEGELAAQIGLSKTPVREALLMLAADGLVYARPGAGYRVSPVTFKDARSLCAHRARLEAEAAAAAAARGVAGHYAMHLAELVEGRKRTKSHDDPERNTEFHLILASASADTYLTRDLARALQELERVIRLALLPTPSDDRGHKELLEAVLSGNVEHARAVALAHAEETEKLVVDALLSSDALQGVNLGRV